MDTTDEPYSHVETKIAQIIPHPDFNSLSLENDLAIVKLDPSCRLNKKSSPHINSICLPKEGANFVGQRYDVVNFYFQWKSFYFIR